MGRETVAPRPGTVVQRPSRARLITATYVVRRAWWN